jgi:hypothetical protein
MDEIPTVVVDPLPEGLDRVRPVAMTFGYTFISFTVISVLFSSLLNY